MANCKKIYVGHVKSSTSMVVFHDHPENVTEAKYGHLYAAITGHFQTRKGADFYQRYSLNNPHCTCVQQAEKLAIKYKNKLA